MCNHCPTVGDVFCGLLRCFCCRPCCEKRPEPKPEKCEKHYECVCKMQENKHHCEHDTACGIE